MSIDKEQKIEVAKKEWRNSGGRAEDEKKRIKTKVSLIIGSLLLLLVTVVQVLYELCLYSCMSLFCPRFLLVFVFFFYRPVGKILHRQHSRLHSTSSPDTIPIVSIKIRFVAVLFFLSFFSFALLASIADIKKQ